MEFPDQDIKRLTDSGYQLVRGELSDWHETGMEDFHAIGVLDSRCLKWNDSKERFDFDRLAVVFVQQGDWVLVFDQDGKKALNWTQLGFGGEYGAFQQIARQLFPDSVEPGLEVHKHHPVWLLTNREPWPIATVDLPHHWELPGPMEVMNTHGVARDDYWYNAVDWVQKIFLFSDGTFRWQSHEFVVPLWAGSTYGFMDPKTWWDRKTRPNYGNSDEQE